jgi:hypothetical protein
MRCGFIGTPSKLHGSKTDRGDQEPRVSERAIANFCIHRVTLILRGPAKSSGLRRHSQFPSREKRVGLPGSQTFLAPCYEFVTERILHLSDPQRLVRLDC